MITLLMLMYGLGAVLLIMVLIKCGKQKIFLFVMAGILVCAFLMVLFLLKAKPLQRKRSHLDAARGFKGLMLKMVQCVEGVEQEKLWAEYDDNVSCEPEIPRKCRFQICRMKKATPIRMTNVNKAGFPKKQSERSYLVDHQQGSMESISVIGKENKPSAPLDFEKENKRLESESQLSSKK